MFGNTALSIALIINSAEASTEVVGYVPDPEGRGTVSLILSCVLTLILCVWSALHLNVPGPKCTTERWVLLNIAWIFAGIYSPEMVVFAAWRQWDSARLLQRAVEQVIEKDAGVSCWTWTPAHSFFACSGGFALELESLNNALKDETMGECESKGPRRLTLTPKGVLMLVKVGRFPRIDEGEIQDKSKANDLSKTLVMIQATWMLIQVIGRLATRLPVTLLEVNTVAHVLCAFAMYLFWWHKPLLPNEPIIIREASLAPLAAFMYSSSEMSGYFDQEQVMSQTVIKTLFANLHLYSKTPDFDTICLQRVAGDRPVSIPMEERGCKDRHNTPNGESISHFIEAIGGKTASGEKSADWAFVRAPESCLTELRARTEKDTGTAFFERRPRLIHKRPRDLAPTGSEVQRWSLIQGLFKTSSTLMLDTTSFFHSASPAQTPCIHFRSEQLVTEHATNWPSSSLLRSTNGLVVGTILWLANLLYGGLHAAAWNDHFPSAAEKWLWRASSIYIAFCGGLWVILNLAVARWSRLNRWWEKWMDGEKGPIQSLALGMLVFICGLSLVLARMYLVIEAFVSIRMLPLEAYKTPQWTDLIPHF